MTGNLIGKALSLSSFGESHGIAIGGMIDGYPSNIQIDLNFIQKELNRRRPGQSEIASPRQEKDKVEFLSGIFEGKTTGTPIGFIIKNLNQLSTDYNDIREIFRPSSADFTYKYKYFIRDHRGGGRASARETAIRVVAGALAKILLKKYKIKVNAFTSQIGNIKLDKNYKNLDLTKIENNIVRCPDDKIAKKMIKFLENISLEKDSIGGIVNCVIKNVPVGLGEPVYDKLQADLAKAMFSINAVKGFDYGIGFDGVGLKGSEQNDSFICHNKKIKTLTNNSGGIQGGISNGEDIYFRVLFKPTSSIGIKQETLDINKKKKEIEIKGRHDVCIVPRAIPIVEAMAAFTIADHLLRAKK